MAGRCLKIPDPGRFRRCTGGGRPVLPLPRSDTTRARKEACARGDNVTSALAGTAGRGRSLSARRCTRGAGAGSGGCGSTVAGRSTMPGGCSGLWGGGAGGRNVVDSPGLVSATISEGATTVTVGAGSGSGSRRISGGGEASGAACEEDEAGMAAIGNFARVESGLVTMSPSPLNRLPEELSLNANRAFVPYLTKILGFM
ncbi:hypothetical protein EDB86DRAFT_1757674 [Lactarius hatsudake]|nr:hypothetical protein EDB86DRAFT_1757674 [Lactarius hatsudake]